MGPIPLFRPEYDATEAWYVSQTLASRWSGMGPRVEEFEGAFANLCGAKHAVAVNSCTSALELACRWYKEMGYERARVPSLTFCSTAQAAVRADLALIFCDVDPDTLVRPPWPLLRHTLDVIVHYGGQAWKGMASDPQSVLHDCAHCSPLEFKQPYEGICCWSFESKKLLSCGDGGMLTTNDDRAAAKFRTWRWCGITRSTYERQGKQGYHWDYDIPEHGFKCHMNDLTASLGLAQLAKLERMHQQRKEICHRYNEIFAGCVPYLHHGADSGKSLFVVSVPNRSHVIDELKAAGITTGVHYKPLHLHTAFAGCDREPLPHTERVWPQILSLPLFPSLTLREVEYVAMQVIKAISDRPTAVSVPRAVT